MLFAWRLCVRRLHRRGPHAVLEERRRIAQHRRPHLIVSVPHPEVPHHVPPGVLQQHRYTITGTRPPVHSARTHTATPTVWIEMERKQDIKTQE